MSFPQCDVPARNILAASEADVPLPLRKPASAICCVPIVIANFIALTKYPYRKQRFHTFSHWKAYRSIGTYS